MFALSLIAKFRNNQFAQGTLWHVPDARRVDVSLYGAVSTFGHRHRLLVEAPVASVPGNQVLDQFGPPIVRIGKKSLVTHCMAVKRTPAHSKRAGPIGRGAGLVTTHDRHADIEIEATCTL